MKTAERQQGFTLIEVLVALAIVIVAYMAMYGSMMQVVAATTLMQEKTFATWIAFDRITDMRLQAKLTGQLPKADESSDALEMAGGNWKFTTRVIDLNADSYVQVNVYVAPELEPDNILGRATGVVAIPVSPQGKPGPPPPQPPPGGAGGITN